MSTWDLNALSEELANRHKAKPAFKGYHGYPYALCTSVNEEVVHGMPSKQRLLREGTSSVWILAWCWRVTTVMRPLPYRLVR